MFLVLTLSYNQPRFSPDTTWDENGIIFADKNRVGAYPIGIFVTSNNSIYIPKRMTGEVLIWKNDSTINPSENLPSNLKFPFSIFVKTNGDIYVDNGQINGRIDKWIAENNTWVTVIPVQSLCYGVFVDIYENFYYSMFAKHQVGRVELNNLTHTNTIVAGTGVQGSASDMLNKPCGIFVDANLDLYIADASNNRIQLFRFGQLVGQTIAGNGSVPNTVDLSWPCSVILDSEKYLFIVDSGNHRIIRSDENGFHCIIGCSDKLTSSNQPFSPTMMSFDSDGNIYVTEEYAHRVQKFMRNDIFGKLKL